VNISKCYLTTLLFAVAYLLVPVHLGAQTLDPEQTVNPATGDMQFSLPLAAVNGVNGHDFSINLNYQAGIQYHAQASEVGLGFSMGAGCITRKVVFVPDDITSSGMFIDIPLSSECNSIGWLGFFEGLCTFLGITLLILSIVVFPFALSAPAAIPAWAASIKGLIAIGFVFQFGMSAMTILFMAAGPRDYKSGGQHTPCFNFQGDVNGYFCNGTRDVPDLYFVNTPYFSGELVRIGDAQTGKFILKKNEGVGQYSITYDKDHEKITIKLSDGTRLLFEEADSSCNATKTYLSNAVGDKHCNTQQTIQYRTPVPNIWYLTKVLFPDYVDGGGADANNPYDSDTPSKGSWICFNYMPREYDWCYKMPMLIEGDNNSKIEYTTGNHAIKDVNYYWKSIIREKYLQTIKTPNQSAEFQYSDTRQDDAWYKCDYLNFDPVFMRGDLNENGVPHKRPELNTIIVKNNKQEIIKKIEFTKDYILRPKTMNSIQADYKCLTLVGVAIKGSNNTILSRVSFDYDLYHNFEAFGRGIHSVPHLGPDQFHSEFALFLEERDLWGYYCPLNPASTVHDGFNNVDYYVNNFNEKGEYARAVAPVPDGFAYAAAWSLNKVSFSNGLSIWWDYEPKIYDMVNNNSLATRFDGITRYDGGIRVKTVHYNDDIRGPKTISYAYTDQIGEFDETKTGVHSSGHATVLPFNALSTDPDYRIDATKGGLYTPTQIAYEMVQVAKGYTGTSKPNGFTVYTYTTPADNGCQNTGRFGNEDNSWKIGFLKTVAEYNSSGDLVKKMESQRSFVLSAYAMPTVGRKSIDINRAGNIYLLKVITTNNNVAAEQINKYSFDMPGTKTKDYSEYQIHSLSYVDCINVTVSENDFLSCVAYSINPIVPPSLVEISTLTGIGIPTFTEYFDGSDKVSYYKDNIGNEYLVTYKDVYACDSIKIYKNVSEAVKHDLDMQPNLVCNLNSNGKMALTRSVPAYFKYDQMESDSVYSPVCQKITYQGAWNRYVHSQKTINIAPPTPVTIPLALTSDQLSQIKTGNTLDINFGININPSDAATSFSVRFTLLVNGQENDLNILPIVVLRASTPTSLKYVVKELAINSLELRCRYYVGLTPIQITNLQVENIGDQTPNEKVVGSSVTTWKQANNTWLPEATYNWSVPLDGPGNLPSTGNSFVDYLFATGSSNDGRWKFKGKITNYNSFSQSVETVDPLNKYSTTVYGTSISLPVASIANADFTESGAFTCDYDLNKDIGYFDKFNGWEKCGAVVASGVQHFGQSTVKADNCSGPSRNFKLEKGKDYILSAWVALASTGDNDKVSLTCDYRSAPKSSSLQFPFYEINSYGTSPVTITGTYFSNSHTWKHLAIVLHASTDLTEQKWGSNDWFARVSVGTQDNAGNHGVAYMDDIRFYPANAQVTTTYYDQLWDQPLVMVDANGKPGTRITYDEFGRPVTWQKYDPANHSNLRTAKSQVYHLMNE
jgi:hypothetical protein